MLLEQTGMIKHKYAVNDDRPICGKCQAGVARFILLAPMANCHLSLLTSL